MKKKKKKEEDLPHRKYLDWKIKYISRIYLSFEKHRANASTLHLSVYSFIGFVFSVYCSSNSCESSKNSNYIYKSGIRFVEIPIASLYFFFSFFFELNIIRNLLIISKRQKRSLIGNKLFKNWESLISEKKKGKEETNINKFQSRAQSFYKGRFSTRNSRGLENPFFFFFFSEKVQGNLSTHDLNSV